MTRALLIAFCLAYSLPLKADSSLDRESLADAIRIVEGYRGRPGALGEEGPYQLRAITWRQHMPGIAFARAVHEPTARACALKHLAWLQRELARAGVHAGVFNLALAYNAGLARVLAGRAPERAYAYARRVENLYRTRRASDRGEHAHPAGSSHGQGPRAKAVHFSPDAIRGVLTPANPSLAPSVAR